MKIGGKLQIKIFPEDQWVQSGLYWNLLTDRVVAMGPKGSALSMSSFSAEYRVLEYLICLGITNICFQCIGEGK